MILFWGGLINLGKGKKRGGGDKGGLAVNFNNMN